MSKVASRGASALGLLALVVPGAGHGILVTPAARSNQVGTGVKLQPFGDARNVANRGCGSTANNDPGVQLPQVAYRPGEIMRVEWQLTIPHPADVMDTGIRVAIHYGPGDSFDRNILIGGLLGDPDFDDNTGDGVIDRAITAGPTDAVANSVHSTIVSLPDKTCNYCTVQWTWAARADGGFYMGCADIAITSTGLLPDYNLLPSEVGNELPQNAPPAPPGSVRQNQSGSGGGGATVPIIVVGLFLVLGGVGYYYYQNQQNQQGSGGSMPPMAPQEKGAPGGPPMLPAGWTAALDPASGRTYYSNAMTGATQWEPPAMAGGGPSAQPAPPPGAPPAPGSLPPGWTEAKDQGSGQNYYINTATGASTWERPTNRF